MRPTAWRGSRSGDHRDPLIPSLPGVLSAEQVRATGASIVRVQEADGAVPWSPGGQVDTWNHVEAAMAMLASGHRAAAERAYVWCAATQRADGSWPMTRVEGRIVDDSGETNMAAYLAVGVWHHWRSCGDREFVRTLWPVVRRALDFVVGHQLPFGGIAWSQEWRDGRPGPVNSEALLAASSSIYQSLRAGVALAELVGDPQPEWELAGGRLGHAVRRHRLLFADKARFSMDWYYPVLGGAVGGDSARRMLAEQWDRFVTPGLGARCVWPNPWYTGAETCELAMALAATGQTEGARALVADIQRLRHADGGYWTGYVSDEDRFWPEEQTTFTAAAVILAVDALSDRTPGGAVLRGETLAAHFEEIGLECGCDSPDRVSGRS